MKAKTIAAALGLIVVLTSCPLLEEDGKGASTQVSTPQLSPAGGVFSSDLTVTISCATTGATIHYTTDGSPPTTSSAVYNSPIDVAGDGSVTTIKAVAAKAGMATSAIASGTYTIDYSQVATPQFSPTAGTYTSDQSVVISCATAGATIHYTADGSPPTTSSDIYSVPILVTGDGKVITITAIAAKAGMKTSEVSQGTYAIQYSWIAYGSVGTGVGQFYQPDGIAVDSDQRIYITDPFNHRVARIDDMSGTGWATDAIHMPYGV